MHSNEQTHLCKYRLLLWHQHNETTPDSPLQSPFSLSTATTSARSADAAAGAVPQRRSARSGASPRCASQSRRALCNSGAFAVEPALPQPKRWNLQRLPQSSACPILVLSFPALTNAAGGLCSSVTGDCVTLVSFNAVLGQLQGGR